MSSALAGGVRVAQRVFVPFVLLAHICCGGRQQIRFFTRSKHGGNVRFKPLRRVHTRCETTEATNRQQRRDRGETCAGLPKMQRGVILGMLWGLWSFLK